MFGCLPAWVRAIGVRWLSFMVVTRRCCLPICGVWLVSLSLPRRCCRTLSWRWQGADGFAGRSSVRVWLVGVARRQALRRLRRFSPELVELGEELGLVSPDSAVVVFERLDHAELLGVLGELRAVHREVLGLLLVEQLSYKEIAVVLGVPLGTVKSRVSNARRALAGLLARGALRRELRSRSPRRAADRLRRGHA